MKISPLLFILLVPVANAGHGGLWHESQAQQQTPGYSGRVSEQVMQREYERQLQRELELQQQIEQQRAVERDERDRRGR